MKHAVETIHSDEVHEIMTRPPSWFVRWGSISILLTVLLLLLLSWFVRYPDVLESKVVITTTPPPVPFVTRTAGHLKLLTTEGARVKSGDLVGYIQSAADITDVLNLSTALAHDTFPSELAAELGELSPQVATLSTQLEEWLSFKTEKEHEIRLQQLSQQKENLLQLQSVYADQYEIMQDESALARKRFLTDSLLYSQKVISELDFNQSKSNWLQQLRNSRSLAAIVLSTKIQINDLERVITNSRQEKVSRERTLSTSINATRATLQAKVKEWEVTYLIRTLGEGTIAFSGVVEDGMFVETGRTLGFVFSGITVVAKSLLPVMGAGKVQVNQKVNVFLDNYPAEQFGFVRGVVVSISMLPKEQNYLVTIQLPEGLKTTRDIILSLDHELSGRASILTDDLRLMERVLHKFKALLQRGQA